LKNQAGVFVSEYTLTIIVQGEDKTAPAVQGMDRMGAGSVAMGGLLAGAMVAAGAAVVGLAGSTISAAADFQNATATFASVAGGALAQAGFSLDDVANKALEMGAVTQFSAGEAQQAMIALAKGGVPIADIMTNATQATLDLAAAGEVGLANAADIVAKQLGVWSSSGVTAADVANTLAQAANASTVDVEELALGLANVGGVAKVSGVSFHELNQTMAMIAPGFSSAADAGTSLKTFMLNLSPSTDKAAQMMVKLGLATEEGKSKFYDSAGAFVGMEEAAGMLSGALSGLTKEQQSVALKTMFGTDAFRAAALIAEKGASGYLAMGDAMDAAGTAAEQAAIRNATFKFAWDSLLGTLQTLQIVIGGPIIDALTVLINTALIPAGNAVLLFAQAVKTSADPFMFLVSSIDSVLPGFALFAGFIQANAIPILVGLGTVIATIIIPALFSVGVAIVSAAASFLLLIAPLAAVGIAAALLYQAFATNFLGLADIVQPMIDAVVTGFGEGGIAGALTAFIGQLGVVGPQLMTWFTGVGELILIEVGAWAQGFLNWVTPMIEPLLIQLGAFAVGIFNWIVAQAPAFIAQLAAWGSAFITWIAPYIGPALAALGGLIGGVLGWIGAQVGPILGQLAVWGAQFIAWIGPMIGPAIAALGGLASTFFGWIAEQAAPLLAQLGVWAAAFVEWIGPATVDFLAAWPGMFSSFLDWIGQQVGPLLAKLGEWAIQFVAWIAPQIPGILVALVGISAAILTWIGETVLVLAGKLIEWGAAFLGWVGTEVVPKLPGIMDSIKTAISDWISTSLTWLSGEAKKLGTSIIDGIKSGIDAGIKSVTDKIKGLMGGTVTTAQTTIQAKSPSKVFADLVGKPIAQGVALGITQATPKATSAMMDMAGKLVGLVSNATGAFGKLANIGTIPQGAVERFSTSMFTVINMLDVINVATRGRMMGSAMQITGGANKVLETIVKGVDGFAKLATMGAVPESSMALFAAALLRVVTVLDEVNVATRGKMMASAMQITKGAEKVVDFVGKGVDAFAKLATMGIVPASSVQAFGVALATAIGELQKVALTYSGAGLTFTAVFAESAGKIMAMVGPAVEGLNKLRTLADPIPGSFARFALYVSVLVMRIGEVAGWMSTAAVNQAATFAEGAGKVLGILGSGVEGFTKLATLGDAIPGMFQKFAIQVFALVLRISEVSGWMSADAVEKAATFADGAGKVIGIIGSGVEGFVKLATFQGIAQASMDLFGLAVRVAVATISYVATLFSVEGVAAAAVFAEGAGKVVSLIGGGVDALIKLATFQGVTLGELNVFAHSLQLTVGTIIWVASIFTVEAVQAAAAFADGVQRTIGMITSTLDAFGKLASFQGVAGGVLDQFVAGLTGLLNEVMRQVFPASQNIGLQLANGIAAGIGAGIPFIQQAAIAAVNAAIAATKAALGIASPSQVFKQQIGMQMSAGMAQGVLSELPGVQQAVGQVSSGALSSGQGGGTTNDNRRSYGPISITVNAAPGQDANAIAVAVKRQLELEIGGRLA
jgi:TP901 family phage tail tape measure protein